MAYVLISAYEIARSVNLQAMVSSLLFLGLTTEPSYKVILRCKIYEQLTRASGTILFLIISLPLLYTQAVCLVSVPTEQSCTIDRGKTAMAMKNMAHYGAHYLGRRWIALLSLSPILPGFFKHGYPFITNIIIFFNALIRSPGIHRAGASWLLFGRAIKAPKLP